MVGVAVGIRGRGTPDQESKTRKSRTLFAHVRAGQGYGGTKTVGGDKRRYGELSMELCITFLKNGSFLKVDDIFGKGTPFTLACAVNILFDLDE